VPQNVSFQISDGVTTTQVPATRTERYEILWFQFTVVAPTSPTPYLLRRQRQLPVRQHRRGRQRLPELGQRGRAATSRAPATRA
jgi:hypothetical protein